MATRVRVGGVLVLAISAAVFCLGPSEVAFAATTFTVNSTASTADAVPGDGICDDGTGACTLGAGVGEAASVPTCLEPVAIHFSVSGQIDAGIEYDFAAGSPCTNPSLSIIGPGADSLILSGGVSASGYVYDYEPQVKTFLGLQGLHVSGALHFNGAAASLVDVIADDPIEAVWASLIITGSSVGSVSNSARYGSSLIRPYGGITVADSTTGPISSYNTGMVSLARVRVSGGLLVGADRNVSTWSQVEDSVIEESPGCGAIVAGIGSLVRTTIRNNGGCGVGTFTTGFTRISITDCTISGNSGAGVVVWYYTEVSIVRSTIAGNRDGGIAVWSAGLSIVDCTISGNSTPDSGGGVLVPEGGQVSIVRSTIAGNRADDDENGAGDGGGIAVPYAGVSISDSIVANNTDPGGEAPDCSREAYPGSITAIRSLIGSTEGCSFTDGGGNLIGVDPRLGPLADNGGLTPTHALLAGSPAIDAAGACTGTDQRGVPRPQGTACDIGAFEFACGNGAVDLGEQCDDGTPGDGDCCSPNCTFEGAGTSCPDDGEPCTADACDGSGTCAHAFPVPAGCHEAVPRGATLAINDSDTDRSDKITWKWKGATELADLGNPAATTSLTLCVADAAGNLALSATIPAGGLCTGRNCWRSTKAGFRYVDPDAASEGIKGVMLKASPAGSGSIKVKGQGESLPLGGLPLALPATVRLLRTDVPVCWESRFATAARNDAGAFRGRAE